jgi:predicted O-methyltransferase YrrM
MNEANFDEIYAGIMQRFVYNTRAHVIRSASVDFATRLPGWAFDAVYIDANHSEAASAADIEAWWPLVRQGGVLAGHDYLSGEKNGVTFGVKNAVDKFAVENDLKVFTTTEDYPSWLVIKPEGQAQ